MLSGQVYEWRGKDCLWPLVCKIQSILLHCMANTAMMRNTTKQPSLAKAGGRMPLCDKAMPSDCVMLFSAIILLAAVVAVQGGPAEPAAHLDRVIEHAMVVTQLPAGAASEKQGLPADGMLHADYGDGARLIIINPDLPIKTISQGFHSASDPEISFDG